jgi:hypothetical protein
MNKNFKIITWGWKKDAPVRDIIECGRKYKYAYETCFESDQSYVFFSDFVIKDDIEAMNLYLS